MADRGDQHGRGRLVKLAIVLFASLEDSDDVRAQAKAAGHRVRDFVRFGMRKRPALLLELER